ncbi:hypothetical protein [Rathayibacter sp. Leaf296]|nr:hypothetical protein [Rathayibacter sp. Leaf296]
MTRNSASSRPQRFAMYICRGCGGEIAYPQRFRTCPMCGIRLN